MKSEDNEVVTPATAENGSLLKTKKRDWKAIMMGNHVWMSYKSGNAILCLFAYLSILSVCSFGGIVSVCSVNALGSFFSLNAIFSFFCVNSTFSMFSVNSYASYGSVNSNFSIHSQGSSWSVCCVSPPGEHFVYTICDCITGLPPIVSDNIV